MELLDIVSWALDVRWEVEIVLHERFVQEWLSHLEAMSCCGSVDSEDVKLMELIHELLGLHSSVVWGWLVLEVEIPLSHFIRTFA